MNNLMIFEDKKVEVFEWNGRILFNPKHVAECLDIKNVNDNISRMNDKQVIKLTNSKIGRADFRELHNTGENFLTESGVYKLIFKSRKEEAERFQDWVTDEVLPSIRKNGAYALNPINEFKGQMATLINEMFEEKMADAKEYYKIKSKTKSDISSYIKKRLGILRADGEYEQVKERVFMILGISKWEDLNIDGYKDILPVIDESIRVIKMDRPEQLNLWD